MRLAPALLASALALTACGDADVAGRGDVRQEYVEIEAEGQGALRLDLDLSLGRVTAAPAEPGVLFGAEVDLPVDQLRLDAETDAGAPGADGREARAALRLSGASADLRDLRDSRAVAWRLYFSDAAPMDLRADFDVADATLDLGGLPFSRLALECGAARVTVAFGAPAPRPLPLLDVDAGAAELSLERLGNARFERLDFRGGVGAFALDLSGDAPPEPGAEADIRVDVARLDLALPRGVPLVLDAPSSFVSAVSVPDGLTTLGSGRYATPGAESDRDAMRVRLRTGPGRVDVRWAD